MQRGSGYDDLALWPARQVLRIESLSEKDVLSELQSIMDGRSYSWHRINELMQARLDKGVLEFTLQDGDVVSEWNNLCDEKRDLERNGRLSVRNCAEFNSDCLINLKIIPSQAGLGLEGM